MDTVENKALHPNKTIFHENPRGGGLNFLLDAFTGSLSAQTLNVLLDFIYN